MIRTGETAASWMNACAASSASTPWTRSSVDRSTRDIIDVMMMTTMKIDAILMPSGRSMMLTTVV